MKKITLLLVLFVSFITLSACNSDDNFYTNDKTESQTDTQTDTQKDTETQTPTLTDYTLTELGMYDGKDGSMAYIAVNGIIYDVTDEWNNGFHNGVKAGADVTDNIMGAPHGETVLENLEIIGNLITE